MASRILLVEDDERIRNLDATCRSRTRATTSRRPKAARRRSRLTPARSSGQSFDLIVVDIMLPGMDGFACCRELRKVSSVPIIMVTALTDTAHVVAGLEAGADDYVTKPFEPKELAARIRALLRRARSTDGGTRVARVRGSGDPARGGRGSQPRRGGAPHTDGVSPVVRAGGQRRQGAVARTAARAGVELRLLRRRAARRRSRPPPPHQGRARPERAAVTSSPSAASGTSWRRDPGGGPIARGHCRGGPSPGSGNPERSGNRAPEAELPRGGPAPTAPSRAGRARRRRPSHSVRSCCPGALASITYFSVRSSCSTRRRRPSRTRPSQGGSRPGPERGRHRASSAALAENSGDGRVDPRAGGPVVSVVAERAGGQRPGAAPASSC